MMNSKCDKMRQRIDEITRGLDTINNLEKKFPKGELLYLKNQKELFIFQMVKRSLRRSWH